MTTRLKGAESALSGIEEAAGAGLDAQAFLEEAAWRIDLVVPSDGFLVAATDPHTTLCLGPGVAHDIAPELCQPTWDHEFRVPDVLKWRDIARSDRSVADLHEATGGRPERSPRWRYYAAASGFRSEVRAAFKIGEAAWGIAQFDRLGDSPRYSPEEQAWLERVAPVVARGLRSALIAQVASAPLQRGPGMFVLDRDGQVVSATAEATAWLGEVQSLLTREAGLLASLPFEVHAYAARVRAAAGRDGAARVPLARLRTSRGVWLVLHAAMLEGTDDLAMVVEPAKAAEVAPLIVEAYGLTQRELDVTRAIARGLGTGEIAAHLVVSPHTVRDHVKSVFEKVGVSSRGELVAKVFAEHYSPIGH